LRLFILMTSLACAVPAWADIPPEPERPVDWKEHPAPTPAPPPEKEEIAARLALLSAVVLAAIVGSRRSANLSGRVEQVR
jgi:hypothetical protein